jgi:hypothetical protein
LYCCGGLLFSLVVGLGCSAGWQQRNADAQVYGILDQRKQGALGYQPQAKSPVTGSSTPTDAAFARTPPTSVPPPATSPVEPPSYRLPAGPLGPEMTMPSGTTAPQRDPSAGEAILDDAVWLQFGPPAPGPQPMSLDLFESLAYAVRHGREYQDRMDELYLAALDVTSERHLFAPQPFARTTAGFSGSQASADYDSAFRVSQSLGVRQQLPYGGEVAAQGLVEFVDALRGNLQNGEDAELALSATVPLLRGAGWVNLEPLIRSERELVYQVRQFEDFRRGFTVIVAQEYFELLSVQQQIANALQNLQNSRNLAERTQALYAAGIMRYDEVQRALQQQLRAENRVVEVQLQFQNRVDLYKLLLGMPMDQPLEIVRTDLDVAVPQMNVHQASELAHRYRLDLQTAEDRVEDATRSVSVARNGLMPDLDLVGRAAIGNDVDHPAAQIDRDTTVYTADVRLDWPLDRVIERNAYRRSLIQLEQARRDYAQLRDRVAAGARESLRGIRSAEQRLQIQRTAIELAERRLENVNELLRQGDADARDVADAQDSLLEAQNEFEDARARLQTQVLGFLRDTGTLRVDPDAGAIGQAMDRSAGLEVNGTDPQR